MFNTSTHESSCCITGGEQAHMHLTSTYTDIQSTSAILFMVAYIGLGALAVDGACKAYYTVKNFNKEETVSGQIFGEEASAWTKAKKVGTFVSKFLAAIAFIAIAYISEGQILLAVPVVLLVGCLTAHGVSTIISVYNRFKRTS